MTVREVLDALAAGTLTVAQVEDNFRQRKWPPRRRRATEAEMWLGVEQEPADPDSWDAVNEDGRLDSLTYERLAAAYKQAIS